MLRGSCVGDLDREESCLQFLRKCKYSVAGGL
jgi:hypothetical protein